MFAGLICDAQPQKQEGTAVPVTLLIPEIACANGVKKYVEKAITAVFSKLIKMTGND